MNKKDEIMVIDTDHHVVEITKPAYKTLIKFCKKNKITLDYYFFEFEDLWSDDDND